MNGMGIILIIVGGTATYFSWWILLHLSDKKVKRYLRPRGIVTMSKDNSEAYREINAALIAIVIMIMGAMLLIGGIAKLFGFVN